jgi:lysyl-tRNA synthetase class 2
VNPDPAETAPGGLPPGPPCLPESAGHRPDLGTLRFRAEVLRKVRGFFHDRGVLEVETPILSRGISLDCHIDVFSTAYHPGGCPSPGNPAGETFYLQTSPEPHMKRLLCQGFPDIWQMTRSFRNGEAGRVHNPEFTMVEWYRRSYSLEELMDEVEALCLLVCGPRPVERKTWSQAMREALGFDPIGMTLEEIAANPAMEGILPEGHAFPARSDLLDFLMAHRVEPGFPPDRLVFVSGFPADQAAQARTDPGDPRVARRFEVYGGGMELGNGYLELLDPEEYEARFDKENVKRRNLGKPELPKDPALLADLRRGLPPCAGVAMGLDRLVILGAGRGGIGPVLSFPWETC